MRIKVLIICVIFSGFLIPGQAQNIFSALHLNEERDVYAGIPRSINQKTTFYNSNGSKEIKSEQTEFDRVGLPLQTTYFDASGNIKSIESYRYDTTLRIILESNTKDVNVKYPSVRVKRKYFYEDGTKGLIKIQEINQQNEILSEILFRNDPSGRPIELKLFEPIGNLIGIETAEYNPDLNQAITSVLNKQGNPISFDTIKISFKDASKFPNPDATYNNKGDVLTSQTRWRDGSMHYSEYEYIYDNTGNWTISKRYDVTYKSNGKKRKDLNAVFERVIVYWQ